MEDLGVRLQLNLKRNIKGFMCDGVEWDMDWWWASVNTVMNRRVPCDTGRFWQSEGQLALQA